MPEDWQELLTRLERAFGPQHWWPADSPFEVMVGAILTQNTSWTQVERAIDQLREAGLLNAGALLEAAPETLEPLLRCTGYYRLKTRRLQAFCAFLEREGCLDRPERLGAADDLYGLRHKLLSVYGVGEETADSILLYALQRPIAVVDAYTRRLAYRLGWTDPKPSYAALQDRMEGQLPPGDIQKRQELHALIVVQGKTFCRSRPSCRECPLRWDCAYGAGQSAAIGNTRSDCGRTEPQR
ncbi:MAG: endonuclease III domain-containing protein [Acidithiobacillus sp.]|uniref:endonuclease III domain-containing protein n=1 Tax=Acidithiobacillus sp. TaxID=1872118 RepID=UPI003D024560